MKYIYVLLIVILLIILTFLGVNKEPRVPDTDVKTISATSNDTGPKVSVNKDPDFLVTKHGELSLTFLKIVTLSKTR